MNVGSRRGAVTNEGLVRISLRRRTAAAELFPPALATFTSFRLSLTDYRAATLEPRFVRGVDRPRRSAPPEFSWQKSGAADELRRMRDLELALSNNRRRHREFGGGTSSTPPTGRRPLARHRRRRSCSERALRDASALSQT